MPPTLANGKICYIEIPATDITRSSDSYSRIFGWQLRQRGDGHIAFDDSTGQVSPPGYADARLSLSRAFLCMSG